MVTYLAIYSLHIPAIKTHPSPTPISQNKRHSAFFIHYSVLVLPFFFFNVSHIQKDRETLHTRSLEAELHLSFQSYNPVARLISVLIDKKSTKNFKHI